LPLHQFTNVAGWHDRLNALDAWRDPFAGLA
jgi:glutathione S-transferase